MATPQGTLTGPQYEILELLWEQDTGMTVSELWEILRKRRTISRTTVLNLVDRLEKRAWLNREKVGGVFRYQATVSQDETRKQLSDEFVGQYFSGSPSEFLLSFLGSQKLSKSELDRMKKALEAKSGQSRTRSPNSKKGKRK